MAVVTLKPEKKTKEFLIPGLLESSPIKLTVIFCILSAA